MIPCEKTFEISGRSIGTLVFSRTRPNRMRSDHIHFSGAFCAESAMAPRVQGIAPKQVLCCSKDVSCLKVGAL